MLLRVSVGHTINRKANLNNCLTTPMFMPKFKVESKFSVSIGFGRLFEYLPLPIIFVAVVLLALVSMQIF